MPVSTVRGTHPVGGGGRRGGKGSGPIGGSRASRPSSAPAAGRGRHQRAPLGGGGTARRSGGPRQSGGTRGRGAVRQVNRHGRSPTSDEVAPLPHSVRVQPVQPPEPHQTAQPFRPMTPDDEQLRQQQQQQQQQQPPPQQWQPANGQEPQGPMSEEDMRAQEKWRKHVYKSAPGLGILMDMSQNARSSPNAPRSPQAAAAAVAHPHALGQNHAGNAAGSSRSLTEALRKMPLDSVHEVVQQVPLRDYFRSESTSNIGVHAVNGGRQGGSPLQGRIRPNRRRKGGGQTQQPPPPQQSPAAHAPEGAGQLVMIEPTYDEMQEELAHRFQNLCLRMRCLWGELKVPPRDREFCTNAYTKPPLTAAKISAVVELVEALVEHRAATVSVLNMIHAREEQLGQLQQIMVDLHHQLTLDDNAAEGEDGEQLSAEELRDMEWKCVHTLCSVRVASVRVIHAIQLWRQGMWRPWPFIYEGYNYFLRMQEDTTWLLSQQAHVVFQHMQVQQPHDLLAIVFCDLNSVMGDAISQEAEGGQANGHGSRGEGKSEAGNPATAAQESTPDEEHPDAGSTEENIVDTTEPATTANGHNEAEPPKSEAENSLREQLWQGVDVSPLTELIDIVQREYSTQRALRQEQRALEQQCEFIPLLRLASQDSFQTQPRRRPKRARGRKPPAKDGSAAQEGKENAAAAPTKNGTKPRKQGAAARRRGRRPDRDQAGRDGDGGDRDSGKDQDGDGDDDGDVEYNHYDEEHYSDDSDALSSAMEATPVAQLQTAPANMEPVIDADHAEEEELDDSYGDDMHEPESDAEAEAHAEAKGDAPAQFASPDKSEEEEEATAAAPPMAPPAVPEPGPDPEPEPEAELTPAPAPAPAPEPEPEPEPELASQAPQESESELHVAVTREEETEAAEAADTHAEEKTVVTPPALERAESKQAFPLGTGADEEDDDDDENADSYGHDFE